MARLEDELRVSLARKEPRADFTAEMMRRVRESGAGPARLTEFPVAKPRLVTRIVPRGRWATACAIAAALAMGIFIGQQHGRDAKRQLADMQAAEMLQAQRAGEAIMHSLQLAGVKMNKAREAVLRNVGTHTGEESE